MMMRFNLVGWCRVKLALSQTEESGELLLSLLLLLAAAASDRVQHDQAELI